MKEFKSSLTEFLTRRKAELLRKIAQEKAISPALAAELKAAADQFKETWKGTSSHAQPTRHTPANKINPVHRADHQGHANGGGLQDAQGAGECSRRPSLLAPALSHSA